MTLPCVIPLKKRSKHYSWLCRALASQQLKCMLWPYGKSHGYGAVRLASGKTSRAHRVICEAAHGTPPRDTEASHVCGNALCCNPAHLRWATHTDNMEDCVDHGTRRRGVRHGRAILTEIEVIHLRSSSISNYAFAKARGLSISAVRAARIGKTWAHVR